MSLKDYDRYSILKKDSKIIEIMPFIRIPNYPSDKFDYWKMGFSRMDKLAQKYYGNPFFDFLILYGNPQYVNEFDIPDNALIRIPFPLDQVRGDYERSLNGFLKE